MEAVQIKGGEEEDGGALQAAFPRQQYAQGWLCLREFHKGCRL